MHTEQDVIINCLFNEQSKQKQKNVTNIKIGPEEQDV